MKDPRKERYLAPPHSMSIGQRTQRAAQRGKRGEQQIRRRCMLMTSVKFLREAGLIPWSHGATALVTTLTRGTQDGLNSALGTQRGSAWIMLPIETIGSQGARQNTVHGARGMEALMGVSQRSGSSFRPAFRVLAD